MTDDESNAKQGFSLLKQSGKEFMEDDCPLLAAALSYYTVFSLPALLVLIILIAGALWNPEQIQGALLDQIQSLVGDQGAEEIQAILENADRPGTGGPLTTLLSIGALIFGATGAFLQLQRALNKIWEVGPDPEQGGIKTMISKRMLSFGMILAIAFLLLVSLVLTAAVNAFGTFLSDLLGGGVSGFLLQGINFVLNFLVITVLFAALFKIVPDAEVRWKDVWVGAAATALLFEVGKFLIGFYLGQSDPASAYGAAGSLAILMLWIFFSSLIIFFGAEFTQVWARRYGERIYPSEGAVRVVEETRHYQPEEEPEAQHTDHKKEQRRDQ